MIYFGLYGRGWRRKFIKPRDDLEEQVVGGGSGAGD